MEVHYHPKARQAGKDNNKIEPYVERSEIPQYGKKNNFMYAHIA